MIWQVEANQALQKFLLIDLQELWKRRPINWMSILRLRSGNLAQRVPRLPLLQRLEFANPAAVSASKAQ